MRGKQAVVDTSAGTIVIDLFPEAAPNHVGLFMKLAREGAYAGTTFHWAVAYGAIQGGDPLSRDPARRAEYGTGGLNQLRLEPNAETHVTGAPDSGSTSFFICTATSPNLDGQYTAFAHVVAGMDVLTAIASTPVDGETPRTPITLTRARVTTRQ
jgi:cyclophilin family peptidyl-prolyl cis-trans isomerase